MECREKSQERVLIHLGASALGELGFLKYFTHFFLDQDCETSLLAGYFCFGNSTFICGFSCTKK
ncbi:hypothetical protein RRF57_007953 [Xylaria bambusicola]|uniref:Uncharacterized protein n=1 Tax=Xylaria bambusicola TaxID=326684 RepID=A0AAN7V163_9PEZI